MTFLAPNVTCANCILRVRYESHKPGEHRFYQCADISISAASGPAAPTSNAVLHGIAFTELDWTASRSEYVEVDVTTGAINVLAAIPFAVRTSGPSDMPYAEAKSVNSPFILDQIEAHDRATFTRYYLASSTGPIGAAPDRLLSISPVPGQAGYDIRLKPLPNFAFPPNSIDFRPSTNQLIFLSIETYNATLGTYKLRIGSLDPVSGSSSTLVYSDPDDTFVNSQWTALDAQNDIFYLLMGNENAPDSLETRLYTVDLVKGAITKITSPDFSKYTISSIYFYKGKLYTLSPGLVGDATIWTLVTIDAVSGAVTPVSVIAPADLFVNYYGGAVFGFDDVNGILYYQFVVADQQTSTIATISLDTGKVTFSGQSVMRHVHNLAL
ncbi:hypothetical protein CAOG_009588 [Capsaspora owczarzaki ATCC 30864]|uniref:Uncharacterized protein n=1 Tax=Capsaspora owczarzaki (strain ATCC 30864) TaxID=595528 RepID=A0A0D2U9L9_CAPO3|nr:hypothetical protein CAOG_009588 [Capsaspora owczarzaki ATCC 30864]